MPATSSDRPVPGEPPGSPSLNLSPEHTQELLDLARQLDEGRAPARPKSPASALSREQASGRSRAYWAELSPLERRVRTLRARIGVGRAAERELAQLLEQLQAQQQDDAAEGGPS